MTVAVAQRRGSTHRSGIAIEFRYEGLLSCTVALHLNGGICNVMSNVTANAGYSLPSHELVWLRTVLFTASMLVMDVGNGLSG